LAQIIYSEEAFVDFERIIEFLLEASPSSASDIVASIQSAILILADHPLIGRKRDAFRRELVISQGRSGYVAMYRYDLAYDVVRVLCIRHQREVGFAE
jgi:plasmid stabilization system protein ParE